MDETWADIDTLAKRPLDELMGDLIVGREPQDNADGFGVAQYFFGAVRRHPFFVEYLMPLVEKRVARRRDQVRRTSDDVKQQIEADATGTDAGAIASMVM